MDNSASALHSILLPPHPASTNPKHLLVSSDEYYDYQHLCGENIWTAAGEREKL
jgi:hypothetical protein